MIVADVDILASHREDGLVRARIGAVGRHHQPSLPRVRGPGGPGDHGIALVVLQPGSVHGSAVSGVHRDLRIELARTCRRDWAGWLPARAVVIADYQNHGRQRTGRTV